MHTSLATPPKTQQRTVRPCANKDCGKLMRPTKTLIKDFPRTVSYGGEGKCTGCYRQELSGREDLKAEARLVHTIHGLESYMANRRRRGVPECGARFEYRLDDAA